MFMHSKHDDEKYFNAIEKKKKKTLLADAVKYYRQRNNIGTVTCIPNAAKYSCYFFFLVLTHLLMYFYNNVIIEYNTNEGVQTRRGQIRGIIITV